MNFLPTPHNKLTGLLDKKSFDSSCPITENPFGLSKSEHTFAKYLLYDNPTETLIPTCFFILLTNSANNTAGIF